ncbi:hypothetical protein HNV11_18740 [Spirosoma taeanense]|uniref:Uncharacterized protein n=1 Tax=Spirosoma taeanense TaxID=2735870 RepID=A0A6M5YAP6_9BACT|nr:hypothetical protein [Spirosoma taeanense]QJW91267.1 hypothetical protein HNV11_18740 [Spirosoma taeanense]
MDEIRADNLDDFLLIDLYLEGWLDEGVIAEVNQRLETDAEFQQRVVIALAMREEAGQLAQEAASRKAVQQMLRDMAADRTPVKRLRHLNRPASGWWSVAAVVILVAGLTLLLYPVFKKPDRPPIARNPPVVRPGTSRPPEKEDKQVAESDNTPKKPSTRPDSQLALPIATQPVTVFVPEKSDDSFGLGNAEIPSDTLTAHLYRVNGPAEYLFQGDTLNLYLPKRLLAQPVKLRLSQQPDSTYQLRLNTNSYQLRRGKRQLLR